MAESFAELGLGERLTESLRAAGIETASPLQAAAYAVLRRGGNVVLHASSGAGVTFAFGLPLIERVADATADSTGPRALVLAPTQERAVHIATALAPAGAAADVAVRAAAPGWRADDAAVLVTTAEHALTAVQGSALKLENVQTWVLTDAAAAYDLGQRATIDTLAALIPRDAQRVITSAELTPDVERLVEAHARRAITLPARAAAPAPTGTESAGQIGYMVVDGARKAEIVTRLLEGVEEALVYTRSAARATELQSRLAQRGVSGEGVRVIPFTRTAAPSERVISHDVPFSADELKRLHANGGTVLVRPAELAHFTRIAAEASFTVKHRRARDAAATELDAFRAAVRAAVESEDLSAQLLVLEPLFDEYAAAEVAAALSALVRRRGPVAASAPAAAAPSAAVGAAPKSSTTTSLTRLFVSIGSRDNVRAGDLVGAITGEAGIKGEQVGRVDIRDSFSVVEVASNVAEKVIRALNGTTMRGRSLRVDFDRKGAGGASEGARRPSGGSRPGGGPARGAGGPRAGAGPRRPRRD